MKRYLKAMTIVAAAGVLALGFGCGKKAGGVSGGAAAVAIMPGADFVMTMDMDAIRGTGFNKSMEDMKAEFEEMARQMNPDAGAMQELQEKLKEVTGLEDDDISSVAIAVELDAVDFDAAEPPKTIDAVAAIGLNKAMTTAQLGEALNELAKEEEVEIKEAEYNGVKVFLVPMDDVDAPIDVVAIAMVSDDKVCVMGPQTAVEAAIDRAQTGTVAEISEGLAKVMGVAADGSQMILGMALTDQMKDMAGKQAESAPQGPQGAAVRSMKSIEGVCFSMLVADDADIAVTGLFGQAEDAEAMKGFVDSMVISGAKMFIGMAAQGEPLPLLDSLQAVAEGNTASLVMTLSEQDIKTFKKIAEQQAQAQPMMMQ